MMKRNITGVAGGVLENSTKIRGNTQTIPMPQVPQIPSNNFNPCEE